MTDRERSARVSRLSGFFWGWIVDSGVAFRRRWLRY
jgi:hypothetical protein